MHRNRNKVFVFNLLCACISLLIPTIIAQHYSNECTTPRKELGECILLPQCPSIISILQNKPVSPENAEYLRKSGCGFQGLEPKVCCPSKKSPDSPTTYKPSVLPTLSPTNPTDWENSDLLPGLNDCGRDNSNRIVGGEIAEIGEFPWMALLEYQTRSGKGFYCGGVLINSRYVLTAAHCIKGKDLPTTWRLISVRLGEYNTSTEQDCIRVAGGTQCAPQPLDVPIESQIAHEQYDPQDTNQYHDIALLRLANSVPYTDYILPICLPQRELLTNSFEDYSMWVAGWGKTETKSASDVIIKLLIKVRQNSECAPTYRSVRVTINDGQLCAGGLRGQDSCRGDSGGPLMKSVNVNGSLNFYILGVVSFGPSPCGMQGWPGVYTRVTSYVPWVASKLKP